ncbi:MAG: beta-galactosidase, partial [Chitinophagaceae bacterium]
MCKQLSFFCLFSLLFLQTVEAQTRVVTELRQGWKFSRGSQEGAAAKSFNDKDWQQVTVPHDWAIYGPFDKEIDKQVVAITQNNEKVASEKTGRTGSLPYIGEGWYRNRFQLPHFEKGQKAILLFEGAMSEPKVFLNGEKVGEWNYGYSYFYFDITDKLLAGEENLLAVHLQNVGQSSRWYPGAGLYRKVSIIVKNQESIAQWGTSITTPLVTPEMAKVSIKTKVTGTGLRLVTDILDEAGKRVASDTAHTIFGNEFEQAIGVAQPQLWSPESPSLYKAVTRLYAGKELRDEVTTRFGIRQIGYSPATGFTLNGKTRKFKGVCLHHDLGPLGAAVNVAALRRQMRILKDMGCDAIRSAHNMPSLEQLELADEMGFLFLAESFDEWARPKVKNGYARFFETDAEKDIVNLVRATLNHPSIVMWSSGNEVPDQHGSEGARRAKWLQEIFHREDPTRPVTVGMDQVKATMQSGFGALLDIPG